MSEYPLTRMGTFLRERKEFITIDDFEVYKRAKVQWYGKGIILRDKISGSEIKTKKQQIIRTDEFVVAEIDAKDGSFGVTPNSLDGAIVSSHYFVYEIDKDICFPAYLEWYVRTNNLQSFVKAQGSTNYSAIRSYTIYDYEIPIPLLTEQHRIVERVEKLAARIVEAQSLREDARKELEYFEASLFNKVLGEINRELPQGWEWKSASEFCVAVDCGSTPEAGLLNSGSGEIPFIKVYNLTFDGALDFSVKPTFVSADTHNTRLKRSKVYPGDVLTNIVGPPLGKVSIVPDTYPEWNINQAIVSFRVNNEIVENKYLAYILQSPDFQARTRATTKGTAGQDNIRLSTCRSIPMPIPPLDEQRRIVAYLDSVQARLASLRELQSQTQEELDALLPSILDKAFKGEL